MKPLSPDIAYPAEKHVPWHAWFGRNVAIYAAVGKRGEPVFHCRLEEESLGRTLAIPQWMFDAATCGLMRVAESPGVSCEALRELRRLLGWAHQQSDVGMVEASHRVLDRRGESDAQSDMPPPKRAT